MGGVLIEAGWRSVYGELSEQDRADDDSGGDQLLPRLEQGEGVQTREVEFMRKETQPPRRFSDASLLGAMETAGKEIDDAELREAMKDSGIGTPATRASIIERLVDVGYIERDGRALVATEKGIQVIRLLGDHKLTSPELTGSWERRLRLIEHGRGHSAGVHGGHQEVHDRDGRRSSTSSRASRSSARSSDRARSAGVRSPRTGRATRAGRARTPAAAS